MPTTCFTAPALSRSTRHRSPTWQAAAKTSSLGACPAYANWFKPRPAYRFSAEDSIYVADSARGLGLGRRLLTELAAQAEAAGVRKLLAVIGDSANAGSIGVHRALGFTDVGIMRSVGWKFGAWRDIVLMEKTLGAGDTTSPE
jgi:L-amino acid N-acyltransferase YncA